MNRSAKDVFTTPFSAPFFQYLDGLRKIYRRDAHAKNVYSGKHSRDACRLAVFFALIGQLLHDISPFSTSFGGSHWGANRLA